MQLRDYQISLAHQGADIIRQYGLVYYGMEMRTGKSLTALYTADLLNVMNVLCVTKKKAISSIVDDYDALSPKYLLDVINYESLHLLVKKYDLIIIDEAHTCGAFPTPAERTKQLRDICKGKPVIFLSGTPTPESYSQLFNQLSISSFSPWKQYSTFYAWVKAGYVTPVTKYMYNREFKDYSKADTERIKRETSHLFVTFSQQDAGFEQLVQEKVIGVQMRSSTYWLAKKIIKDRVFTGKNGELIIADTAVKVQNKCHQIFSGTVICEDRTKIMFDDSKLQYILNNYAGQKIAIFYKFDAEGEMLRRAFPNWTDDQKKYNSTPDAVYISQVVSGREGVNLSSADVLIMFNIDFSAVSYWQSRACMQTKDRQKEAVVHWLFSIGGIEEKIYAAVQQKKDYTLSYFKKDFGYAGKPGTGQNKNVVGETGLVGAEDYPAERKRVS